MPADKEPQLTIARVAVRDLKPGANVRKAVSEKEIEALARSLETRQWQPITISMDMTILDGWRRYLAAVKAHMEFLWAVVTERPLTEQERVTAQLVMGLHRKDFTEQEKVLACEELMQACPGLNQKQLAAKLDVDSPTICKWLSVSTDRVIPEVRQRFFDGAIKLMHAYVISQLPREEQAGSLPFALGGATRSQMESLVRRQKQGKTGFQVSRVRFLLPDGSSVTFAGKGVSVDSVTDHLNALLNEARKARSQNLDIKTLERIMADKARATTSSLQGGV